MNGPLTGWMAFFSTSFAIYIVSAAPPATILGRDGAPMVLVPAGEFVMGSGEGGLDEGPPRRVDLPAFYIDRHEVTNEQYLRFIGQTGHEPPRSWGGPRPGKGMEKLPVTDVTWFDAMQYAVWAGKRLPTEAEWEKAARGTDGRRFPWGNLDIESARQLGSDKPLQPVGSRPPGASPFGCLDMAGNAWEWVADWYDGYPGTTARSVHFGQDYKVMRGGGAIYFYGYNVVNAGRCSQRARLVPFGSHDGLGFRCVQDLPGARPAYDAARALAEAQSQLQASLKPPVTLSHEKEFAGQIQAAKLALKVVGAPGQKGIARTGVPFPQDALKDPANIRILKDGRPVAVQTRVLSTWANHSPRWVLVDFPAEAGGAYELDFSGQGAPAAARPALQIERGSRAVRFETGAIAGDITADGWLAEVQRADGTAVLPGMELVIRLAAPGGPVEVRPLPAERLDIEEAGPLHGLIRLRGRTAGAEGAETSFRYDLRIHVTAGSPRLNLLLTLTHFAQRKDSKDEYEKPMPSIPVAGAVVRFRLPEPATETTFGGDRGPHTIPSGQAITLLQPDDLRYTLTRGGEQLAAGTRAPGWVAARGPAGWMLLGVRHFWQNHAKALLATPQSLAVNLWAGAEPFEWESGLAKTHEIILDFSQEAQPPEVATLDPLRVTLPPSWACASGGVGTILPRGPEAIERFAYWELLRDAAKRRWVQSMPFGMRDFGDAYMGGPYKGKNAYANLEYDVPMNFLMDFLKTGQVWLLEAAEVQTRHQVDVDVDHFLGRQWKHSPQHTTTEAEFGHVFVRGMLLHYLLTGETRSLEVAQSVGDWMAPRVARTEGMGNERQIGWSMYALTGLYEVTKERRYLDACVSACRRLSEGQTATGKFNIRWDNRISFFNGIAMMGMLTVQELTGDEAIARTILAVARRTLGFYPEYACRTLNAFCWAAEQKQDPRYLVEMERTWKSSMEFLMGRDAGVTEEVYAWRFTWFACRHQLFPLFEQPPAALPEASTWRGLRLDQQRVEAYLRGGGGRTAAVMLIVEGQSAARAELFDPSGKVVRTIAFDRPSRQFQPVVLTLPGDSGIYRLSLTAETANAWQIHYDAHTRVTVCDPGLHLLPVIYPRATGFLKEGAREVAVRVEAMGEGFHSVTLYTPSGQVAAAARKFVDLGDVNRYVVELKAPVSGDARGWSLEVCNGRVLSIDGFLPYWAGDRDQLFNPERPGDR